MFIIFFTALSSDSNISESQLQTDDIETFNIELPTTLAKSNSPSNINNTPTTTSDVVLETKPCLRVPPIIIKLSNWTKTVLWWKSRFQHHITAVIQYKLKIFHSTPLILPADRTLKVVLKGITTNVSEEELKSNLQTEFSI